MKKIFTLLVLSLLCVCCLIGFAACDNKDDVQPKTYTVTFNSDGGTEISPVQVENGKKCVAPLDPVKQYYIFDGWYVGNEKWSFIGYAVTDNITLTAKWSADERYLDIFNWEHTNNKYIINGIKDNSITDIIIPDYVTEIGTGAFQNCTELENVTIPNNIEKIGYYAFQYCYNLKYTEYANGCYIGNSNNPYLVLLGTKSTITNFSILNKTKIIYDTAFALCKQLSQITIPDNIISIGMNLFEHCESLTSVNFTTNIKNIPAWTFSGCSSLTNFTIHESVIAIEESAFFGCSGLNNITLPDGITSIGDNAFWGCVNLANINIPDSVKYISGYAFTNCSNLQYNEFDNGYYLGNSNNPYFAFIKTKSYDVTSCCLHNNTKIIADIAFAICENLTNVSINNTVTYIGISVFNGSNNLTNISFNGTKTEWKKINKRQDWNYNSSITQIICTDGTIEL